LPLELRHDGLGIPSQNGKSQSGKLCQKRRKLGGGMIDVRGKEMEIVWRRSAIDFPDAEYYVFVSSLT